MHELADRLRELRPQPLDKMEIKFGVAGLIESATLIQFECAPGVGCGVAHCPTRTKVV